MEKLNKVINQVLNIDVELLDHNTSLFEIEGWDSLMHMNLIVAIEEDFNIQLTMEEIIEMKTLLKINEVVNYKLKQ